MRGWGEVGDLRIGGVRNVDARRGGEDGGIGGGECRMQTVIVIVMWRRGAERGGGGMGC